MKNKDFIEKVKFLSINNLKAYEIAEKLNSTIQRVYHALQQISREKFETDAKNVLYHSKEWRLMRQMVLDRDGHKCVRCGAGSSYKNVLQVEHKLSKAYHPEYAFDMNNLITLCLSCHKKTLTFKNGSKKVGRKI